MRFLPFLAVAALAFSGCLQASHPQSIPQVPIAGTRALIDDHMVTEGQPYTWTGTGSTSGATKAFTIEGGTARVVLVAQPININGHFTPEILDSHGTSVADKTPGEFTVVAIASALKPGAYQARIQSGSGAAGYLGSLHVEAAPIDVTPGPAHDLLPDLETLVPRDLRIANQNTVLDTVLAPAGYKGCGPYELVESLEKRCLRFSNAVTNVGDGPMEVRLIGLDEATGMAGQSHFTQNIHRSDGTNRTQAVGVATFHPTHQHYHYAGLAHYDVYHYDVAANVRGAKLNEGKKSGFCFLDSGIRDLNATIRAPYYYNNANCFDFLFAGVDAARAIVGGSRDLMWADEVMGISPGWFDFYDWYLDDQVVDMVGAADGTYQLVSCANAEKTIVESDLSDNCANVLFELKGDQVTTIGPAA